MTLTETSPARLAALVERLEGRAASQLRQFEELPRPTAGDQPDLKDLLKHLHRYWKTPDAQGTVRRQAQAQALRDDIHDEALLRIADGSLHPGYLDCLLPAVGHADEHPDAQLIYLAVEDSAGQPLHGALLARRADGACLLYVPGHGIEGFVSEAQLREELSGWLNDQALRGLLLQCTSREYQQLTQQIDADPDLDARPFSTEDLLLVPVAGDPFQCAIDQLLDKQRQDLGHVCAQFPTQEQDLPAWQLELQAALHISGLLGPAAMLRRRQQEQAQRRQARQLPHWLRYATPEEKQRYLNTLLAYDRARIALDNLMQGCGSAASFARTRLTACIQSELGYDLDPDRVVATTRRLSPLGSEPYETRRSLTDLALYGLYEGDLNNDSSFQTATRLSLDDQPLQSTYPLLTPAWLAGTVARLDLRARFGEAQRQRYGNAQVKSAMDEVLRQKLLVQATAALYQGHIQASDFLFSEALLGQPGSPRLTLHQVRLNNTQVLADLLLISLPDNQGQGPRLLLWTPESPDGQPLRVFRNERQVRQALVAWSASQAHCDYLLEQTLPQQRQALREQLLALREQPQPPQDFLGFIEHPGFNDALYAMSTAQVRVRLAEQQQHTPDWYLRASPEQRQALLAHEEAIEGLTRQYRALPHTQLPEYEHFVHQQASRKINALLGLPEGTVDPDQIIVSSPRETLSYTRLLRDGYDDTLGFLTATADTQATFTGPQGVDLSPLTPEKVAGSVRGAWASDAWVAHLQSTLLAPHSDGYNERRRLSLTITQLQMHHAALLSLLQRQISSQQFTWLSDSIARMDDIDEHSRRHYPVYPLHFVIENPFIASDVPALGELINVLPIPLARRETALGCFVFCPADSRQPEQALLYTPGAPDGLAWRPLSQFHNTLHAPGMSDYYKDRCRLAMNRTLAFWFIDLKKTPQATPPTLPDEPLTDLRAACFDQVLLRKIRDVQDSTSGRSDMISRLVWNSIELVAMAVTLPFPPASFAVGALLTLRDSARALQALSEGDREAASLHLLGAWLNALGAAGDASAGLKGFGGLLHELADRGGHNPAMTSLRQAQAATVARIEATLGPVLDNAAHDAQKLLLGVRKGVAQPHPGLAGVSTPQANPAYASQRSLDGFEAIASGHARGVTRIDGHHYIPLDGRVYEVQYDAGQRLWQIIDPANPFAFYGKQPVRLNADGQWQVVDIRGLRGGGGHRFERLENEPTTPTTASTSSAATTAYELGEQWKPQVMGIAIRNWVPPVDVGLPLSAEFFAPLLREGREVYAGLRETLRKDAENFFQQASLAAKADLPALQEAMTPDDLIKAVFDRSQGMVVSERLQSVASKQFLIDHMPRLAEQNVEILYLEHLFTDLHVDKLRKYHKLGSRSRGGSAEIKEHLDSLNQGALINGLDHKHDYYHVIKAAHRHGIEVRPLNSSVSYDFLDSTAPLPADDPTAAQKMAVFFGSRIIAADTAQAPARRWVALLEQRHANTHRGVPGIAELHGAVSVRVEDVAAQQPVRILRDLPEAAAEPPASLGDFRLEMPNPRVRRATTASETSVPAQKPEKLDLALAQLLRRQEYRASTARPTPALSRALLDQPGPHGFELDEAGHWRRAAAADWPTSGEPTALQRSLADPLYQMPTEHLDAAHELAFFEHRGLHLLYSLDKDSLRPARRLFFTLRARLQRDARTLSEMPLPPRPTLPDISGLDTHAELIDRLYEQTSGLVIGEYHSSIASKQFIIDNLPHLARREVKTLYLEHLQTDMHQLDLDLFFDKGLMSKRLLHYLKQMDRGFFTDPAGVYTFEQLVVKAREHGIEVRALDCMPSYYLRNLQNGSRHDRLRMMNFFASRTLRRHQELAGAHHWIALVGETHANRFETGIPGLADLEQGISLRVYDLPPGEHFGPAGDPGRLAGDELGGHRAFVRNDFALGLPTAHGPVNLGDELLLDFQGSPVERQLYRPGLFTIESAEDGGSVIVHRSRRNQIERTPVLRNAEGRLYVDRQRWRRIHLQPFEDLPTLVRALERMNMTQVS
ncbi:membrane-targeted effector domain-containing toxin [Pseudomonas sp. DTU_2021_1001937_2_SI_NGA_ILE_001]|uniref:membrane-targeted effector domain-containing toxin n=1 Tax=Pseudomonas sp. DTU_2021_1001937_2_SI_NGA_ILE_001 TaxID=3077589 RepID=UPI0028FC12B4|nr:membrane-targeted effector domain-containing toxin [Pseudomonas sp. DTU_2021_1001937_2_SI_NGA_ILE_001]WNW13076.1 membrane-targeted effector domain-containing toxin [Pseudomonas sp. DTU_2021_1001937_2_SI_NGA_ILE_001]